MYNIFTANDYILRAELLTRGNMFRLCFNYGYIVLTYYLMHAVSYNIFFSITACRDNAFHLQTLPDSNYRYCYWPTHIQGGYSCSYTHVLFLYLIVCLSR